MMMRMMKMKMRKLAVGNYYCLLLTVAVVVPTYIDRDYVVMQRGNIIISHEKTTEWVSGVLVDMPPRELRTRGASIAR